jgi:hypothetical protein
VPSRGQRRGMIALYICFSTLAVFMLVLGIVLMSGR